VRQDFWKKQWPLMQQMHSIAWSASDSGAFDEQAARKNYEATAALEKQMFDNGLELRKAIDGTLTPKQRDEMRRGGRNW
jgi:Spy/CpxP family protein refolding chaperone